MSSTFFGINVALTSLYAQRQGLEVTGHNVANVNTDGYSRQRVNLESVGGGVVPAMHATWLGGGAGVTVNGVDRLRDQFLEQRALGEHASDRELRQVQSTLARVEMAFAEPSDNGLQAQMADFWAGWGDVANNPTDLAARAQILERASTLANGFNRVRDELGSVWDASVEQLQVVVADVNATAARIGELNGAIERATVAGLSPNDLADQRDRLVLQLGEAVGATARAGEHGQVDVFVGGTALVRGVRAETLEVSAGSGIASTSTDPVQVRWAKDGYPASVSGGTAGGLLGAIDGDLPEYRRSIDAVAERARRDGQRAARHGVRPQREPGRGPVVLGSRHGDAGGGARPRPHRSGERASGPRTAAIAQRRRSQRARPRRHRWRGDGPDAHYRSLIVALGVQAQAANRRVDIQSDITNQVDAVRDAGSGVNLDEEMANMVAYQHAYSAAARHLTAVDEMLATLMSTGIVGR